MRLYTRRGDDGTTGLLYGGRVRKDSPLPTAYGAVDEAQAALGVVRAMTDDEELSSLIVSICRELYVAMAELATAPDQRHRLTEGEARLGDDPTARLEQLIDDFQSRFVMPTEFVIPGGSPVSAALDVARTTVRRAERDCLGAIGDLGATGDGSNVVAYLNRLSDLLWALARWTEGGSLPSRGEAALDAESPTTHP